MDLNEISLFVVINDEGKYFRRKGREGSGDTWVNELKTARIWTQISGARSIVTFFANHYPKYPPPKIIKLNIGSYEVLDETERVTAAKEKKQKQKEKQAIWLKKWKLEQAEAALKLAEENLKREKNDIP